MDLRPDPLQDPDEAQIAAATAVLLDAPPVRLQMTRIDLWMIFSTLQFALRHPAFPPAVDARVRAFLTAAEPQLALTPELAAVLRRGWDPAYDVPAAAPARSSLITREGSCDGHEV